MKNEQNSSNMVIYNDGELDKIELLQKMQQFNLNLKDLGKKWFAFSKFEIEALEILGKIK